MKWAAWISIAVGLLLLVLIVFFNIAFWSTGQ
jgi:hypothetical protein